METVIYVAVALVAGVAVGKFLLAPQPTLCQIRIPLGTQTQLASIYVSLSARETVLWTGADSVTSFAFGVNSTVKVYPSAAITGADLNSNALATTVKEGDQCDYTITARSGTTSRTYNGRIIIQK